MKNKDLGYPRDSILPLTVSSFYENLPVLVTGCTGFIGPHLLAKLYHLNARVTTLNADIRDKSAVMQAVAGQRVIFHLAGHSGAVASNLHPLEDMEVNCAGLLILLEACRKINVDTRIIFPSSRLVYGHPQSLPVKETHPTCPTSIYGIHKLTSENYLRLYYELYGLPTVSLRITNAYGPSPSLKSQQYGILNVFMHLALTNRTIHIYGDGSQLRDFIYIDDLVEAFLWVGQSSKADGGIFNICGGQAISLLETAQMIVSLVGHGRIERVPWPEEAKQVETGDFLADITKIRRTIGWRPRTMLEEGIQRSLKQILNKANVSVFA